MNLLESMQTMIRPVKISSFVSSILTVTIAIKCDCTHYRKISTRNHVYTYSKCGHQSCLFAGTIFQDYKLDLYKLCFACLAFFSILKILSNCFTNQSALANDGFSYSSFSFSSSAVPFLVICLYSASLDFSASSSFLLTCERYPACPSAELNFEYT